LFTNPLILFRSVPSAWYISAVDFFPLQHSRGQRVTRRQPFGVRTRR
jgi:hypothetical protein